MFSQLFWDVRKRLAWQIPNTTSCYWLTQELHLRFLRPKPASAFLTCYLCVIKVIFPTWRQHLIFPSSKSLPSHHLCFLPSTNMSLPLVHHRFSILKEPFNLAAKFWGEVFPPFSMSQLHLSGLQNHRRYFPLDPEGRIIFLHTLIS